MKLCTGVVITVIGLLLTGCVVQTTAPPPPPTHQPTYTPRATYTPLPLPSATPTPTATPEPTWTPGPMLSAEAERQFFDDLFATNGGCEFPCWWGITPGVTSWDELLAFFNQHGVQTIVGETTLRLSAGDTQVTFANQQGTVNYIRIEGPYRVDTPVQPEVLSPSYIAQFSPAHAFSTLGTPSQVYVTGSGVGPEGPPGYYHLWSEYADQGILLGYSGFAIGSDTQYLFCLESPALTKIEMWLYPQDNRRPFESMIQLRRVAYLGWDWQLWHETIEGLSLEDFVEAFSRATSPGCLRVFYDAHHEIARPANLSPFLNAAEDALLVDMLRTNGGCTLPCWWGITPGVTSITAAQQMFLSTGNKPITIRPEASATVCEIGLFARHATSTLDYVVTHHLVAENDTVSQIHIHAKVPWWASQSQHLTQDWQNYTLASMLTRWGPPSRVKVFYHHPSCGQTYSLYIVYDALGIMAVYSGVVQRDADIVHICPNADELTNLDLTLSTPDYLTARTIDPRGWDPDIDPQSFYLTYRNPATAICLELPEQVEYTCE